MKGILHRICVAVICLATVAQMAACQKSPDSSLVVNKDLDKLIDEANTPDTDKVDINDITEQKYDTYVTTIKDDSLGVTVNVDAKVDIPTTDHLSIFRVEQQDFTQEFIDKVKTELLGDVPLYDGSILDTRTKKVIENEIAYLRTSMNQSEDEVLRAEYQTKIDKLQAEYESAPTDFEFSEYPHDGKLHTTAELYQKDSENESYIYQHNMNPGGEVLDVVTDGSDGTYSIMYVQNNDNTGNKLEFSKNKYGYYWQHGIMINTADFYVDENSSESVPDNYITNDLFVSGDTKYIEIPGDSTTISLEDAMKQADVFLDKIGLDNFTYYEGGLYSEYYDIEYAPDPIEEKCVTYRNYYILRYYRNIDGAFLTQSSGTKNDPGDGNGEAKRAWPGECIEIRINDSGIVGFNYNAPINVIETVVDNSALMSFDDIKDTFEKMMPVTKASKYYTKAYDVDRVRLSYSRISEADSFDTGLIVTVWDFSGFYENAEDNYTVGSGYGSLLAINAIDGSIIDPDLGY